MKCPGVLRIGFFALLLSAPAAAVAVTDGDGLRIGSERIRLWGIDAPELDQQCKRNRTAYACGTEARSALERLVSAGAPSCERLYKDPYGRTVARCSVAGADLGGENGELGLGGRFQAL